MFRTTLLAAIVAAAPLAVTAAGVIDFEDQPFGNLPGALTIGDVTFSSPGTLNIVDVNDSQGDNRNGFVPNDNPNPVDALGERFLATAFATVSRLVVTYGTPVTGLNFDLADIDGSGDNTEVFTITARDADDNVLVTEVLTPASPGAGDRNVVNVSFASTTPISSFEVEGTTEGGQRLIGIAFDNFDPTMPSMSAVPVPAGLPLLLGGLGAFAWMRRRQQG